MTRLAAVWAEIRDSLWFLPAVLTAAAVALAFTTIWVDQHGVLQRGEFWFLFAAGSEGARGVLSTIAGGIITITGVVFSVTIVALQLASSQFTPRVLRSFMQDRPNQVVLGVFIATFTYALLVLRAVRSPVEQYERFVPALSVTVALVLTLISVGCLIFFVNHIARSMQAEVILNRVARDALQTVDQLFPEELSEGSDTVEQPDVKLPDGVSHDVTARHGGYLQAVDEEGVLRLAREHDLVLEMQPGIGDFVLKDDTLARAWPVAAAEPITDEIRGLFRLGPERTRYQDVERGVIELVDIGVRALSPGINDPTTALVCIDRLTQVLAALGGRRFPDLARRGPDGRVRFIARRPTFDDVVQLGFGELRHHGAAYPAVAIRLIHSIGRLAMRVPASRRAVLHDQLREVLQAARREIAHAPDIARIEHAAEQARIAGSDASRFMRQDATDAGAAGRERAALAPRQRHRSHP